MDFSYIQADGWKELRPEEQDEIINLAFESDIKSASDWQDIDPVEQEELFQLYRSQAQEVNKQTMAIAEPELISTNETEPESRGFGGFIKDTAIDLGKGIVGTGQAAVGLLDLVTFNLAGDALDFIGYDPEKTTEILSSGYSDARQASNKEVQEAKGFWGTVGALVDNPDVAFGSIIESSPMSLGSAGVARQVATKMLGTALVNAEIKAGTTAAKAFAAKFFAKPKVIAAITAAGASAEGAFTAGQLQEEARADGKPYYKSVLPAIGGGLGTAGIGIASSKIPGLKDAEAQLATAGMGEIKKRFKDNLWQIGKTMIKEGPIEEGLQSSWEQGMSNIINDKPFTEGIPEAAGQGTVVGMGQGGGMAAASNIMNTDTKIKEPTKPPKKIQDAKTTDEAIEAAEEDLDLMLAESQQFESYIDDLGIVPTEEEQQWEAEILRQHIEPVRKAEELKRQEFEEEQRIQALEQTINRFKNSPNQKVREENQRQIEGLFSIGTPFNEGLKELENNIAIFRREKAAQALQDKNARDKQQGAWAGRAITIPETDEKEWGRIQNRENSAQALEKRQQEQTGLKPIVKTEPVEMVKPVEPVEPTTIDPIKVLKDINQELPGNEIALDAEPVKQSDGRTLYSFTPKAGDKKGQSFSTFSLEPEEIKASFDRIVPIGTERKGKEPKLTVEEANAKLIAELKAKQDLPEPVEPIVEPVEKPTDDLEVIKEEEEFNQQQTIKLKQKLKLNQEKQKIANHADLNQLKVEEEHIYEQLEAYKPKSVLPTPTEPTEPIVKPVKLPEPVEPTAPVEEELAPWQQEKINDLITTRAEKLASLEEPNEADKAMLEKVTQWKEAIKTGKATDAELQAWETETEADVLRAQKEQSVKSKPIQYEATNRTPGEGVTIEDIQAEWKGQKVFIGPNKEISIHFDNGQGITVTQVKSFKNGDKEIAFKSGQMGDDGIILGKTEENKITINQDFADQETISHENWHVLKNLGIVNNKDEQALLLELNKLEQAGKFRYNRSQIKDKAKARQEDLANVFAQIKADRKAYRGTTLGKIIQKITDFFNRLTSLGRQTVTKLAKESESGKLYSREAIENLTPDGNPQFLYIGSTAKEYNKNNFKRAIMMDLLAKERDYDPDEAAKEIRSETGWFKGRDDLWRFEIDDSKAYFKKTWKNIHSGEHLKLSGVLTHNDLFKHYPDIANIRFLRSSNLNGTDTLGSFSRFSNTLKIRENLSATEAMDTMIHELQHWIQYKEGFAVGGNVSTAPLERAFKKVKLHVISQIQKEEEKIKKKKRLVVKYQEKNGFPGRKPFNLNQWKEAEQFAIKVGGKVVEDIPTGVDWDIQTYKQTKEQLDRYEKVLPEINSIKQEKEILNKQFKKALDDIRDNIIDTRTKIDLISDKIYGLKAEKAQQINHLDTVEKADLSTTAYEVKKINIDTKYDKLINEQKKKIQRLNDVITTARQAENNLYETQRRTIKKKNIQYQKLIEPYEDLYYEAYRQLAGEVEARDVSARRLMSKEERAATAPYTTQGIDAENMFIQYEHGKSFNQEKKTGQEFSTLQPVPKWYSALEKGVEGIKQEVAPADQWKAMIAKLPVKKEELEWVGVNEWLDEQTGKVSKQDVIDFITDHNVQLEEVMLGETNPQLAQDMQDRESRIIDMKTERDFLYSNIRDTIQEFNHNEGSSIVPARVGQKISLFLDSDPAADFDLKEYDAKLYNEINDDIQKYNELSEQIISDRGRLNRNQQHVNNTVHSRWQEPGGENYRELLLTMPNKKVDFPSFDEWFESNKSQGNKENALKTYNYAKKEIQNKGSYKSSHFSEPNIVAHIRFNDRVDADGNRVLFFEEIQSDWHQAGRKEGYRLTKKQRQKKDADLKRKEREGEITFEEYREGLKQNQQRAMIRIPNAPFKKSWPLLAIKRMVRYAAENGYDKIAWTTGEQQAARYDLSKQVDRIEYEKNSNGTYSYSIMDLNENEVTGSSSETAANLEDIVGKEIVKKMEANEGKPESFSLDSPDAGRVLSGLDLKVGGEGMKAFYDKMLPSMAKKFFKKFGGRIEEIETNMQEDVKISKEEALKEFDNDNMVFIGEIPAETKKEIESYTGTDITVVKARKNLGMDITPQMKVFAVKEGMPMFATNDDRKATQIFDVPNESTRGETAKHALVDVLAPVSKVQRAIEKATGKKIKETSDYLMAERLRRNKTGAQIKADKEELVQPIVDRMVKRNFDTDQVDEALLGRHAPEANKRLQRTNARRYLMELAETNEKADLQKQIDEIDEIFTKAELPNDIRQDAYLELLRKELQYTVSKDTKAIKADWLDKKDRFAGITNEEAEKINEKWASDKDMQAIMKMVDKITAKTIDISLESGRITQTEAEAFRNTFKYYVPLQREGHKTQSGLFGTGQGIVNLGKDYKIRGGSTAKPVNMLANVLAQHERAIERAGKAEAGRTLLQLIRDFPNKYFWKISEKAMINAYDSNGNLYKREDYKISDNEIPLKIDGKYYIIWMNPDNVHAMRIVNHLKGNNVQTGTFIRGLAKLNRYFATIHTGLNPEFILTNLPRDIQIAAVNLSSTDLKDMTLKVMKDIPAAALGLRDYFRKDSMSEWGKIAKEYAASGGMMTWADRGKEVEKLAKDINREVWTEQNTPTAKSWKTITQIGKLISDYNSMAENATRLAAYKNARDVGLSKEKAAVLAKELTVNFEQKGLYGELYNSLYLFSSAGVQGSARLISGLVKSSKARKIVGGMIISSIGVTLANGLYGGDDDEGKNKYSQIKEYEKERNMLFVLPNLKSPIKIPLGWGLNFFWNIGTEIGDAILAQGNDSQFKYDPIEGASRMLNTGLNAFNPIQSATLMQMLSPTFTDPIVQIAENKTFFGAPLMPERNKFEPVETPDSQRFWKSVRPTSKFMAEFLNGLTGGDKVEKGLIDVSPETMDLAFDTLTGGLGRVISGVAGLPQVLAEDEIDISKVPFARKFFSSLDKNKYRQDYYDNAEKIHLIEEKIKVYPNRRREFMRDPKFRLTERLKSTERQIKALRKILKQVKSERSKQRLEDKIKKLQTRFNDHYNRRINK